MSEHVLCVSTDVDVAVTWTYAKRGCMHTSMCVRACTMGTVGKKLYFKKMLQCDFEEKSPDVQVPWLLSGVPLGCHVVVAAAWRSPVPIRQTLY